MVFSVVLTYLGKETTVDLCDGDEPESSMTVLRLKEKIKGIIADESAGHVGVKTLRLYVDGKLLAEDSAPLSQCGIGHMAAVLAHVDLVRVETESAVARRAEELHCLVLEQNLSHCNTFIKKMTNQSLLLRRTDSKIVLSDFVSAPLVGAIDEQHG